MRMRSRKLTPAEHDAVLQDNMIGTLSLIDGDSPFAVQLEYLYHEGSIYMATYVEGRKINCLNRNNRVVFTVFEDRHSHPEMIRRKIRCRSVMAEGRVETIYIKEVTNYKGTVIPFRLLKLTIEKKGSWECARKKCNQAAGIDNRKFILEWIQEARQADQEK